MTDCAIFPTLVAAFSRNVVVGFKGAWGRGWQVKCWGQAAPPSCWDVLLVVCAGMGCAYLCAVVRLRDWDLECFSLLLSLKSSILLRFTRLYVVGKTEMVEVTDQGADEFDGFVCPQLYVKPYL